MWLEKRNGLDLGQRLPCSFRSHFVLHHDVRLKALAVLRDKIGLEVRRERGVERSEALGLEEDRDASTDGPWVWMGERKGWSRQDRFVNDFDCVVFIRQVMEEGKVRRDEITFGREVAAAQFLVEGLRGFVDLQGEDQRLGHARFDAV